MIMAELLTSVGSVFTWILTNIGEIGETVMSTPILAISVLVPLAGVSIGFFKRLLSI